MSKFIIKESPPLRGSVRISGSKNAALPILAASLMTREASVIQNVPPLSDILIMRNIIESYGAEVVYDIENEEMTTLSVNPAKNDADHKLFRKIRASFLVMGPLLARLGKIKLNLPGGCSIGGRPIDLHLKGFAAMGASISLNRGFVTAEAPRLKGADIYLDFPSVGATENIVMAACLADGITTLRNSALEPEVTDLCRFLLAAGADITGIGTDTLVVTGVRNLKGTTYRIIPDRIEAGTFMAAAVIKPGGDVLLENAEAAHLRPVMAKLKEMGARIEEKDGGGAFRVLTDERLSAKDIKTLPYPGFPTDMQAQFMALLAASTGRGVMTETVFENRYMHAAEMSRMGASIKIDRGTAIIDGVKNLSGCPVTATDLRAGAALVVAALSAGGTTEVSDIHHIDRGYNKLDEKLRKLGAKIIRID